MSKIFYTRHDGGLTLYRDGKMSVVSSDHQAFDAILVALAARKFDELDALMDVTKSISFTGTKRLKGRKIFVSKGEVYYTDSHGVDRALAGPLVDRILQDLGKPGFKKFGEALMNFMDNMMKNKRKDIREEIYDWLISGKTPFTPDGCFLAYKKVRGDYKDIYTGTMDNSPGTLVHMPQSQVDTNRHNTCSVGLHFCSRDYLEHYGSATGNKIVIVKVNPRHVFAIPTDYSFQKGRASEYFVVGEYKGSLAEDAFKDAFIDDDNKATSAPNVTFSGWLRPSLEKIAGAYGLVNNGKVLVIERRGKYVPVKPEGAGYTDILGTWVEGEPKALSIDTKSVKAALKAAFNKADRGLFAKASA